MAEPTAEPTLYDFLRAELAKALARQPNERAQLAMLARAWGFWSLSYREFARDGYQPFGRSHPTYGDLSAGDFIIILGMIDGARAKIERMSDLVPTQAGWLAKVRASNGDGNPAPVGYDSGD